MKRKILSSILLLVVVLQLFSLVVFAEGSANATAAAETDLLLEEMKANMTDEATGKTKFDISKYPKSENGSPLIIGGYESGIFDELDPALYVYIYNPSEKQLESVKGKWVGNFTKSDGTVDYGIASIKTWQLIGASGGDCVNRFYKFKVTDLSDYTKDYLLDCTIHYFTNVDLTFTYADGTKIVFDNSAAFSFGLDKTNKKLLCDISIKETEELEVGMTCYRHGSVDADLYTVNQINTAYFSVPDRYAEYFENIYSIASTYKKKTTVPIMWGDFPSNYRDYVFFSVEREQETTSNGSQGVYVFDTILKSETGVSKDLSLFENGKNGGYYWHYYIENKFLFDETVYILSSLDGSDVLPNSVIMENFEKWQNDGSNKKLFVESEYCYTTRTIDQSFNSLTYDTRVEDYGFWSALINGMLSGKVSIDEDLYDIPYIVCCDDAVRKDLADLSKTDFCYKYFIHESDYEDFELYLKTHTNVYLYRFDISEHWSDELNAGTIDSNGCYSAKMGNTFGICQTAYYDDFQVVNLTFKNEDSYLSVAVTSDPQDFIGPGEVVDGDPDKDEFGDWLDKLRNELKQELEKMWATIKRFMTVIAVIVVVILVVTVVGHFTGFLSNVSNIFKNNRKNE